MKTRYFLESSESLPGLELLKTDFLERFAEDGIPIRFAAGRETPGFSIQRLPEGVTIRYAAPCDAYRALGILLADDALGDLSQNRAHKSVGVMWDLSRHGVLTPQAWERLLRKFALMGINAVQLYMEDTYAIEGEPFFGYGRGAYFPEELRRIDDCGHQLGIEIIPCVQTLGHLEQILQWPAYAELTDVRGVLLVGEEGTRRLITKMLDTLSACFRSRVIHIGMDEAHGVGTGRYQQKHGAQRPFDVLTRHLQMVVELCRERGLRPMMWSDMFFRIGSKSGDYYDQEAVIPNDVAAQIPQDVALVYWDYYHADPEFYGEWIRRHRALGKEPIFAAGAWSWGRLWASEAKWRTTLSAGMRAARDAKLDAVLLTIWGDDGDEYHPASVLPTVQYFAEWAYEGDPRREALTRQFPIVSPGSPLGAYSTASGLDDLPTVHDGKSVATNPSKWLLWNDPVLGFLDYYISDDLPTYYAQLAEQLDQPDADDAIRFAVKAARVLALKTEIHKKARAAYRAGDVAEIRRLHDNVLPACQEALRALWDAHRAAWEQWKKPFGWEVLDRRYGGSLARLESLGRLLEKCLADPSARIPEWDFEPAADPCATPMPFRPYARAITPSASQWS